MEVSDKIILTGEYRGFKAESCYTLGNADEKEVAAILGAVSDQIEPFAFSFSEINVEKIKSYAKPNGTGLAAVISFLKAHPQNEIKEELKKYCPVPELLSAAESCFLNSLMAQAKVSFRIGDSIVKPIMVPVKESPEDCIAFIGKYKNWVAIKKLGLENIAIWEVSGVLSAINHTAVNKAFDFSGVVKNDALVSKVTSGKRKSYGNLIEALENAVPELVGDRLADAYVICKIFETLGFKPYASPEMLTNAHPEIKPPKVKGRKPKG